MDVTQLLFVLAALATVLAALPHRLGRLVRAVRALSARLRGRREGGGRKEED